jgi:molybdate transport system substrate-binding protein
MPSIDRQLLASPEILARTGALNHVSRRNFGKLVALSLLGPFGCGPGKNQTPAEPVRVLAAASSVDALREIADGFTAATGAEIRLSADDSGKLATQIVHGAPADLFLSANEQWADFVRDRGFALETKSLLSNTLVLIVPAGNPAAIARPADLTAPAVKKVALAGQAVPAGIYARQALTHLQLLNRLEGEKKIVSGENVRAALAYVERGEVEAGIVFATDARITDKVKTVFTFPAETHAPIVYPLVLLRMGTANEDARKFYDYLQGETAAEIFRKHSFVRLGGN